MNNVNEQYSRQNQLSLHQEFLEEPKLVQRVLKKDNQKQEDVNVLS